MRREEICFHFRAICASTVNVRLIKRCSEIDIVLTSVWRKENANVFPYLVLKVSVSKLQFFELRMPSTTG